ncbi:MAG: PTS sugar transporter subunit IIB [Negativicutes bacterium]|nr:PTS sugar transporter subunit IIB [Negativicutes bacterium]
MKIICLCGMGLGSSLIAKMNIEAVLEGLDIQATVETCDIGSINSEKADLYVTTRELAENIPHEHADKTVILTNFVRKDEIKAAMAEALGKLKRE